MRFIINAKEDKEEREMTLPVSEQTLWYCVING